ncbi:protein kinase superfamily [Castilleja foliolosa]|uniref:Protein kinase superfamily n=1 Tax=Castilleja foliolosa TaxID=1961234 RepID=A0ABD3C9W4_9LAMI
MELVLIFIFIVFPFTVVYADTQVDALGAFKKTLYDPTDALHSWNTGLFNPCTWFHTTCDGSNSLTRIDLGNSELAGPLVSQLGTLGTLQYLELYNNKLNGPIPAELGNLTNLVSLDLYDNSLTGPIPEELTKLKSLKFLRLNNNNLSGSISKTLADYLGSVNVVDLSGNSDLCGEFIDKPCP